MEGFMFAKVGLSSNRVMSATNFRFFSVKDFISQIKDRSLLSYRNDRFFLATSTGAEDSENKLIPFKSIDPKFLVEFFGPYSSNENIKRFLKENASKAALKQIYFLQ